jgi:hypothetical protein
MLFVRRIEPQDSYLLYDGQMIDWARRARRIAAPWKSHHAFYLSFACWSWNYKSAYGGRVIPVKTQRSASGASFDPPQGTIEPSDFFDEEAEKVKQKHIEEQKEEEELVEILKHNKLALKALEEEKQPKAVSFGEAIVVEDENTSSSGGAEIFFKENRQAQQQQQRCQGLHCSMMMWIRCLRHLEAGSSNSIIINAALNAHDSRDTVQIMIYGVHG